MRYFAIAIETDHPDGRDVVEAAALTMAESIPWGSHSVDITAVEIPGPLVPGEWIDKSHLGPAGDMEWISGFSMKPEPEPAPREWWTPTLRSKNDQSGVRLVSAGVGNTMLVENENGDRFYVVAEDWEEVDE